MSDNQGAITESTTSSPYYLHPSDSPGALITSVLLKGYNYTEWATELSNSIQAKEAYRDQIKDYIRR